MKQLLIDGNSIINRAFYGIRLLSTKDGRFTNAIYGFMNIFLGLLETTSAESVAVAFDLKKPTFRHEMYSEYKAGRKPMPAELAQQFPVLKELLGALGYVTVECEGFEADDILGTLSAAAKDKCYIATGDRDSLQLVNENVTVILASTKMGRPQSTEYDTAKIKEDYGVTPGQLIDIKALMGDASDNIPGVAGIGQKTACALIEKYHDIDKLYSEIEDIEVSAGIRDKLKKDKGNAYLSRTLGTISKSVPIETDSNFYIRRQPDVKRVQSILTSLEMYKMLERLELNGVEAEDTSSNTSQVQLIICSEPDSLLDKIKKNGKAFFCVGVEDSKVSALDFAIDGDVVHVSNSLEGFDGFCSDVFKDRSIEKYVDDSKKLFSFAQQINSDVNAVVFDVYLAGYLLNPNASDYSLNIAAMNNNIALSAVKASGDDDKNSAYLSGCAAMEEICGKMLVQLEENGQIKLLRDVEIPLARVLASMESIGFAVDALGLERFGRELDGRIEEQKKQIYMFAGCEFNINSPKQLGEVLFEKLGLPAKKKTKTGYSTNAEVLESLADVHPIIPAILQFRSDSKLKSTYCDGLLKVVCPDGRIRSTFNQTETRTGRISSSEPNLQNIPVRQEYGRELRRFFIAEDGFTLVDADYSQIELRVLADIADDGIMQTAFNNDADIHRETAAQVFNMPVEMVTPIMRSRAKAVNFGIVYGIGAFSLAKDIHVTRKEADEYIKNYLHHYSGVDSYMKAIIEKAKSDGFVSTLFNRRRYLPELTSSNGIERAFGERVARNMPIQGTAADIIKIAMVRVYDRLKAEGLKSRLILQVHDELIVEAKTTEAEYVSGLLKEEMENAVKLRVKLPADVHMGKSWYEAKA